MIFATLVLIAGCTDGELTSPPSQDATAHREESELQWVPLGTAELGTVGPIGALPWTSTGIYVPEGVVARIWLRGKLQVSYNQAFSRFCGLGFYRPNDCYGYGFDGHQVGGAGIDIYYLAADIRIRNGDRVQEIGFGKPVGIDGAGDPVLASVTGPGILEVSRTGFEDQRFSWPGLGAEERYLVSGSQTLEVEALGRVDACGGVVLEGSTEPRLHADCVPTPKPEPKPRMKCTDVAGRENVVVRGGTIICRVVNDPDTSWVPASGWQATFTAVRDVTVYPPIIPHPLPPRQLQSRTVKAKGPEDASSWSGTMVVNTTIEATIDGSTLSANIVVQDRANFRALPPYPPIPAEEYTKDGMPYPPVSLGHPTLADGVFGLSKIPDLQPGEVDTGNGPNEDWWYVTGAATFLADSTHMWLRLNVALRPQDLFFRAQRGSGNLAFGRPMCDRAFMTNAARATLAHERGHFATDAAFYQSVGAALVEQSVVYDDPDSPLGSSFGEQIFATLERARSSAHADWDTKNQLVLTCDFNLSN
jgi:hypothetical protein